MDTFDFTVIGGGIVGLSTAYQLLEKFPGKTVAVIEKESGPAKHQSGRNSGVLHTGIYYKPGSLKAQNCRAGIESMKAFCSQYDIPHEVCGKVIVATREEEKPALHEIFRRGKANGVRCEIISREHLLELEPHAAGIEAIHVPEAGIVDYPAVCSRLAELIQDNERGHVFFSQEVTGLEIKANSTVVSRGRHDPLSAGLVINCAGLHSDDIVRLGGHKNLARIIPFKGEYYMLKEEAKSLCRNLIYPVPDPAFPFLGVHFTRMVHGEVECGPNAVPALGKEAYDPAHSSWSAFFKILRYSGTRSLFAKHWRMGLGEIHRSLSKKAFVKALQKLVPEIREDHLEPAPCGIRAQAVFPDGGLVEDFLIQEDRGAIHVVNAPSPAATSALNIGLLVADKVEDHLVNT